MKKLKERWDIKSNFQLVVIFAVFAINGTMSARIGSFLMDLCGLKKHLMNLIFYYIIYFLIVTLIYPFLIIVFGFIFGQYVFFFKFAKKMLSQIGLGFIFDSKKNLK